MSKMLYLGMSLNDIIYRVTVAPLKMFGIKEKSVGIAEGQEADLTIFAVKDGQFPLVDSCGKNVTAPNYIEPVLTIKGRQAFQPRKAVFMKRTCSKAF